MDEWLSLLIFAVEDQVHCLTWASLISLQFQLQQIQCSLMDSVRSYIHQHVNKITFRYTHTHTNSEKNKSF